MLGMYNWLNAYVWTFQWCTNVQLLWILLFICMRSCIINNAYKIKISVYNLYSNIINTKT